jgi:protein O-mannosyl-transferase
MKSMLRIVAFSYLPLAALSVLVYSPMFTGGFILDDRALIENNLSIRKTRNPFLFFFQEDGVVDRSLTGDYHTGYYRPLTSITYWMDSRVWEMSPSGFRTTNLALHILASLLLFHVLLHFCRSRYACLAVAVIFALHPVHTESVAIVTSRNNILVTIFSLASMLCWFRDDEGQRRGYYSASVLFYATALGFKEFAVMLIPIFFLYKRLHRGMVSVGFKEIAGYIPFVLITFLYLFARYSVTESYLAPSSGGYLMERARYVPWLILLNLKYLLFPSGLHSFITAYPEGLCSVESIAGISVFLLLCGLVWGYRRSSIIVFSFLGFILALFPVLNIIKTSAVTLISMRWLYFPAVFASVALPGVVARWLTLRRHLTVGLLAGLFFYSGGYSYVLNRYLWHDEQVFFRQEATHFNNDYYFDDFARQLNHEGLHDDAEIYYRRALDRYATDPDLRVDYAGFLIGLGRLDDAFKELQATENIMRVPIHRARWYNNTGTVYFMKKEYGEALKYFRSAVSLVPADELFRANEGSALGALGRYDEAIEVFEKGLRFHPESEMLQRRLKRARRRAEQFFSEPIK